MKRGIFFLGILVFVFLINNSLAQQNKTMIVEANILSDKTVETISIEVPDYVFLGNVSKGESTDKAKIYVNNTGTVDITITPQLKNPSDVIFRNLFFQNRQSGNNSAINKIGDYSFNIEKPSSSGKRSEYFYMWLDLSNFDGSIVSDLIGEQEEVIFVALPQS